ncbi:hypothetical protein KIW84_014694 [Lathyrus oleraceus]|uniref:Uncharacterized protein n=1 Tax=Pisum sativum TaxID=3888 RepID=A0A9D5BNB8_PEA|nr:hypothetical protein KIW84_014694 [Pisum sativum]
MNHSSSSVINNNQTALDFFEDENVAAFMNCSSNREMEYNTTNRELFDDYNMYPSNMNDLFSDEYDSGEDEEGAQVISQEDDEEFRRMASKDGFDIRLTCQPPNSHDLNVLDLGFFNAIKSLQQMEVTNSVDELIQAV